MHLSCGRVNDQLSTPVEYPKYFTVQSMLQTSCIKQADQVL